MLAMSLALWSVLMLFEQFSNSYLQLSDLLGPIPQLALGIAMVMVLAENERNAVQENALAFSTLGVDPDATAIRRRSGSQHAKHSGPPGCAAAHRRSGHLHFGALARGVAFSATRFLA